MFIETLHEYIDGKKKPYEINGNGKRRIYKKGRKKNSEHDL